ncbi:Glutathione S-transferase S1 [Podila clonocystis]|nr:Glutathione S-transferase S1 [Podila clonocystis]
MVHAYFNPEQAALFDEMVARKDTTFEVHYYGIHGLASSIRTVLAAVGATFTSVVPADWAAAKAESPFGLFPTLTETSPDGKKIHIAETDAIMRYLCRKFGLLGRNLFEETVINTFTSSTNHILGTDLAKYFTTTDPDARAAIKEKLLNESIKNWLEFHERYLRDNGSNGHYVGSTLSFADVQTAHLIKMVNGLYGEVVSEEKYPALWKVHTTLEAILSYRAWTQTESYKQLSDKNKEILGF